MHVCSHVGMEAHRRAGVGAYRHVGVYAHVSALGHGAMEACTRARV